MISVMAFGTFDGLHDGHRSFLRQARQQGDRLIIVVAQDASVVEFKNRPPRLPLAQRIALIREEVEAADIVIGGDEVAGSWEVVRHHQPNIIALGHDQDDLHQAFQELIAGLEKRPVVLRLEAYKPEVLHNSLLQEPPAPDNPIG